MTLVQ